MPPVLMKNRTVFLPVRKEALVIYPVVDQFQPDLFGEECLAPASSSSLGLLYLRQTRSSKRLMFCFLNVLQGSLM